MANLLFGFDNPIGETIRLQNLPFKVIGTMEAKGFSPTGFDQDDIVVIPYTTAMKKLKGVYWLDDIYASAVSSERDYAGHRRNNRVCCASSITCDPMSPTISTFATRKKRFRLKRRRERAGP